MSAHWSLQDAKNRFSTVVDAARKDGPQTVTKRGIPAVVVLAADEFERLQRLDARPGVSFVEFLLTGPRADIDLAGADADASAAAGATPRPDR